MDNKKHYFLVGIGGVGMQGLARLLLHLGNKVSGSDMNNFGSLSAMEKLGINIVIGHNSDNLSQDIDEVIRSVAIPDSNVEIKEAKKRGLPVLRRLELVGELMKDKRGIAISGTHGKTTTTKMIELILVGAKLDPTVLIGAEAKNLSANIMVGDSDIMVVEGCEYGRSFLDLKPKIAIITNIEADHLDYYKDLDEIKQAFVQFAKSVPKSGGVIIANGDDKNVRDVMRNVKRKVIWVGFNDNNDLVAKDLKFDNGQLFFSVENNRMHLHVPGRHHVADAILAWALARELGIDNKTIMAGLHEFNGVERRFEMIGEVNGITFIDDYAHHPTEIKATLEGMKEYFAQRRLLVVFHPHQFSRTKLLLNDFAKSFADADIVVVAPIYAVRDSEEDKKSINAETLVEAINKVSGNAKYMGDFKNIKKSLLNEIKPGDVVITLGAGNANVFGKDLFNELKG